MHDIVRNVPAPLSAKLNVMLLLVNANPPDNFLAVQTFASLSKEIGNRQSSGL